MSSSSFLIDKTTITVQDISEIIKESAPRTEKMLNFLLALFSSLEDGAVLETSVFNLTRAGSFLKVEISADTLQFENMEEDLLTHIIEKINNSENVLLDG